MDTLRSLHAFRLPITTLTCRQQHQHWHHIILQQEEEMGQLRTLLLDLMDQCPCRRLQYDAIGYYRDLNQLEARFDCLHRDLICRKTDCVSAPPDLPCADVRFGQSAMIEQQGTALVDEFARIKAACVTFLSGLMSLNLL